MKKNGKMKCNLREINKQASHGITLVALVITIIILIILAGISLNFILGDDGIMNIAVSAREQTTIESIRERLELVKSSAYVEGEGKTNISKYFEQLEKEKINPYIVTNVDELTDLVGIVEVDRKYSYLVEFAKDNLEITYEGKVGEVNREVGEIAIELAGEKIQTTSPIKLTATVTNSQEQITNVKWSLKDNAEELGTEETNYEQSVNSNHIDLEIMEAKTWYLHVLTTDKYGRKAETISKPIAITAQYHTHTGNSGRVGGCYGGSAHTTSYPITRTGSGWCSSCGAYISNVFYACGESALTGCSHYHASNTCNHTSYSLICGKSGVVEKYTIQF